MVISEQRAANVLRAQPKAQWTTAVWWRSFDSKNPRDHRLWGAPALRRVCTFDVMLGIPGRPQLFRYPTAAPDSSSEVQAPADRCLRQDVSCNSVAGLFG